MSRILNGVKPAARGSQRAKIIISGGAGVGKTWFSLDFPSVYYIDVEGSAERSHYAAKLEQSGGAYFGVAEGSQNINAVTEEIITLATVPHEFKTVVIDSFSKLYGIACFEAEARVGNDFGADKKEANKPTRKLLHWLEKLDMNVILICHPNDKWGKNEKGEQAVVDTTFDGMKKLDHELDLWIEVIQQGNSRKGRVRKSRLEGFTKGERFDFTFDEFAERYGVEHINAERQILHQLATPEKIDQLTKLMREAGVGNTTLQAWLNKAGVESIELLPADITEKCIAYCQEAIGNNGSSQSQTF